MYTAATLEQGWRVAALSGCIAVASHLVLLQVFRSKRFPAAVRKDASFAAHQVIATFYMVVVTAVGGAVYLDPAQTPSTPEGRLLAVSPTGRWLAAVLFGELVVWDIPCGVLTPSMRDATMMAHHVGMAVVSYIGFAELPMWYAVFFLGFIELSSIPLQLRDLFHPLHFKSLLDGPGASKALIAFNEYNGTVTAVAFLVVRGIMFPYVTLGGIVPDSLTVLETAPEEALGGRARFSLQVLVVLVLLFALLQAYWTVLHGAKFLRGYFSPEKKKAKARGV